MYNILGWVEKLTEINGGEVMETPIYTRLWEYHRKNRISFAMPGHKNQRTALPDMRECDVTELDQTVDLHHDSDSVRNARRLLSELYGTRESFIMTCGSTAGIQTMISSILKPGDTLLAAADCHMSVINMCAVCGFKLRLIPVNYDAGYGVPRELGDLELTDDVGAVLITSPNYYGITKDISHIAETCHKNGIPLLVDEAHGAHFIASDKLPCSAVSLGADMVCQSAHKTLNALTGAAYLHICSDRVDIKRVKRALAAFQTSSPSYPIAASADIARATLKETSYDRIIKECSDFAEATERATEIRVLKNDDPTRLVLNFSEYDIGGAQISERLSKHFGIDVEMADVKNIVLIATPWNTHNDFMKLFEALCDITAGCGRSTKTAAIAPPPVCETVISPADGWFAETELADIDKAVERIAAASITAYPPGTAIIVTGEQVRECAAEYIKMLDENGISVVGLKDNKIEVVK